MNITINPQLSSQTSMASKKNVKFGNYSYDGEFEQKAISSINKKRGRSGGLTILSYISGVALLFCGISAIVKNVLDSSIRKQLEYDLYEQAISPNGEEGAVITTKEKESCDKVLEFYDENCNKSLWAWKSVENSTLRDQIKKAVDNSSEEGLNLTDTEKTNIDYYMNI